MRRGSATGSCCLSGGRVCGEGTVGELAALAARRNASAADSSLEEVFLALT